MPRKTNRDYYQVLKLTPDATLQDIRKAYRNLALKFHPDKNTTDPDAETKFKEIGEAYSILSDPIKRKKYDVYRTTGFGDFNQNDGAYGGAATSFFDMFSSYMSGGGDSGIGLNDAFKIFTRFMYEGGANDFMQSGVGAQVFQGDDGKYLFVDVPLETAKNGGEVSVKTPTGKEHKLTISGILAGEWNPLMQIDLDDASYWVLFRISFPEDMTQKEKEAIQLNLMFHQTVQYAIPLITKVITDHPWLVLAAGALGLAAMALTDNR